MDIQTGLWAACMSTSYCCMPAAVMIWPNASAMLAMPVLQLHSALRGGLQGHTFTAACLLYSSKLKAMQVLSLQADIAAL